MLSGNACCPTLLVGAELGGDLPENHPAVVDYRDWKMTLVHGVAVSNGVQGSFWESSFWEDDDDAVLSVLHRLCAKDSIVTP